MGINNKTAPGGACDPKDPSILHACARELHEETRLVAECISAVIHPEGRVFMTRSGNMVCKFEFIVQVHGSEEAAIPTGRLDPSETEDAAIPTVKLDPDEHVDFRWATQQECIDRQATKEGKEVQLVFTNTAQRETVLEGFRILRDTSVEESGAKRSTETSPVL